MAKLLFKHEETQKGQVVGPLYIAEEGYEDEFIDFDDEFKSTRNYQDGRPKYCGGFYAKWFTLNQAQKIAKKLNMSLEEI